MSPCQRARAHVDHIRQLNLDRLNWLHVGAALRGGHVSIEDEDQATAVREAEEKARMENWKKGPFVKQMWLQNQQGEDFRLITVGLDSMARSASGEPVSFVPLSMISEYSLGPIIKIPEAVFNTASDIMTCTEAVDITWMGSDKVARHDRWMVLPPESGIQMPLLGERFMACFGELLISSEENGIVAAANNEEEELKKKEGEKLMMSDEGQSSVPKKPTAKKTRDALDPKAEPAAANEAARQDALEIREEIYYKDYLGYRQQESKTSQPSQPSASWTPEITAFYNSFTRRLENVPRGSTLTSMPKEQWRQEWAVYWRQQNFAGNLQSLMPRSEEELVKRSGINDQFHKPPPEK